MIRGVMVSACFVLLGLVSFWGWTGIDEQLCRSFPSACIPPQGLCAELDKCGMSTLKFIALSAVVFGPSTAFGIAAAISARRQRGFAFWSVLAIALVLLHWTIMTGIRLA